MKNKEKDSGRTNEQNNSDAYKMLYGSKEEKEEADKSIYDEFDEFNNKSNTKKIIIALIATAAVILAAVFGVRTLRDRTGNDTETTTTLPAAESETEATQASAVAHIYFDANGGIAEFTEKTAVIGDSYNQLPKAAKEGYVFEGWFTEREGGEPVSSEKVISGANETVYAHWSESGKSMSGDNPEDWIDSLINGNSSESDASKPETTTGPKTTTKPKTATTTKPKPATTTKPKPAATTKKATYTLSYSANGGSGAPADQSGGVSYTIPYAEPVRNGYKFLGWSENSNATTPAFYPGEKVTLSANVKFYAVWKKATYTLSYNANGGSGAPASQSGGVSYTIPYTKPVRNGYTFLGWSEKSSATAASWTGGDVVTLSGNATLYAVWKKAAYTLSYNANGGSGAPAAQSGGVSYTISYTEPVRNGYTFLGWSENSSATSASWSGGDVVTLSDNVTLYAVWKQKATYTVTFNANGGTCSTSYKTVESGGTISMPTATRDGYRFLGWYNAANGGTQYTSSTKINSNVDLYAQWEQVKSELNSTFTSEVVWENGVPIVKYDCYIKSNYKITDYKVSNNVSGRYVCLNPDCAGKYNGHHPTGTITLKGYPAGTVVEFTVTASDTSGKTISNNYYVTL